MKRFKVHFVCPDNILFDGIAWQVSGFNREGRFSIRIQHLNFITSLKPGIIEIANDFNNRNQWKISSGILEFNNNICNIICDNSVSVLSST